MDELLCRGWWMLALGGAARKLFGLLAQNYANVAPPSPALIKKDC
ncbi:hypothetical protein AWB76_06971 [Caballeronia temeraria]|uniref:Uncharacterized protein n=1 Tax=Caballeronia temeraria TaxID=1777137 RepID=A0A158DJM0_9BURK|nr:hypothetical protein AWB76_06971 [Caballeronia temeraria]